MILVLIIFIIFLLLFFILSLERFNPASSIFDNIIFPNFSKRIINKYQTEKTKNLPKLELTTIPFGKENADSLPFFKQLKYLISFIISCLISFFIFIPICYFLGENNGFNALTLICYITLFEICFASSNTASALYNNRKKSLIYSLIIFIITYSLIMRFSLDGLDIRTVINAYIDINPKLLNFLVSLFISLICYCFSNTALRYFEVFRVSTQIDKEVGRWRPCFETFKEFGSKREILTTLYTMNPITTIFLFFGRRFVLQYDYDTLYDLIYLIIQLSVSIFHLLNLKSFLQMLVNDTYRYLTNFEQNRTRENGKMFYHELNKQLTLLASNSIALISYSAAIIICSLMYIISLLFTNSFSIFIRVFSLFFIGLLDVLISCNKFATVVIEP